MRGGKWNNSQFKRSFLVYIVYQYYVVILIKQLLNLFKSAFWLKSFFKVTFFAPIEQNCHEAKCCSQLLKEELSLHGHTGGVFTDVSPKCWLLSKFGQLHFMLPLWEALVPVWQEPTLQKVSLVYKGPKEAELARAVFALVWAMFQVVQQGRECGSLDNVQLSASCWCLRTANPGLCPAMGGHFTLSKCWWVSILEWSGFHLGSSFGCFLLLQQLKTAGKLLSGRKVRFPSLLSQT